MTQRMPRIVGRRSIYKGWNNLEIVTVETADAAGRTHRIDREVIDHGHASVVLIVDRRRGVAVMVRQWRAPLIADDADPYLLEACAGIIDPGETPEQAARREAAEETGLTIGAMRKIGSVVPSAGTLTERMHLFIADVSADDRTEIGGGNAHEGEDIEVVEVPLAELYDMARRGAIEDAKTLLIVQHMMIEEREAPQER